MKARRQPQDERDLFFSIYESELRLIAGNSSAWNDLETGGTLFGFPTHGRRIHVALATPPCPYATHQGAHFADEHVEFQRRAERLMSWAGLSLVGTWHSHHSLGLTEPSGGDCEQVKSITGRNDFSLWVEIITTHESSDGNRRGNLVARFRQPREKDCSASKVVRANTFFYRDPSNGSPARCPIKVLPGISPYRQALLSNGILAEESLGLEYSGYPLGCIRFDRLDDELKSDRCEVELSVGIRDQLEQLPKPVQHAIRVTTRDKFIVFVMPVGQHHRVQVAFDRESGDHVCAVYLFSSRSGLSEDITGTFRTRKASPSLVAIHDHLIDALVTDDDESEGVRDPENRDVRQQ